ncbi:hypothetical protein KSP40_PGU014583 [Platanthera guangdongensis]|uniref:Beta-catenin-like protein 1 N-terminal domain-containing protein n=1 Tax=Platanthera guangdongensis TaxID=2320717 RepID=A0ABR2MAB1_9ASPA
MFVVLAYGRTVYRRESPRLQQTVDRRFPSPASGGFGYSFQVQGFCSSMDNRNKRRREDETVVHPLAAENGAFTPSGAGEFDLSLLEALENSDNGGVEVLDIRAMKKLVLSFERRLRDNLEGRMKYPEQPEKFADTEVELHEDIERLKILAGTPELYPELVALNTVSSIVGLLGHDNIDIAIDVVGLLMDLTDEDVLEDNDEPARILVEALIENNALELLVQNISRLSEADPDETAAIYNTLSTIENMVEIPLSKKNKKESYQEELEERIISLIASLFAIDQLSSQQYRSLEDLCSVYQDSVYSNSASPEIYKVSGDGEITNGSEKGRSRNAITRQSQHRKDLYHIICFVGRIPFTVDIWVASEKLHLFSHGIHQEYDSLLSFEIIVSKFARVDWINHINESTCIKTY